jgi:uncharacterized protein (TIGR03067 family)
MQICHAAGIALCLMLVPDDDPTGKALKADLQGAWVGFSAIRSGAPSTPEEAAQITFIIVGDRITTLNRGQHGATRSFEIDAKADPMTMTFTNLDGDARGVRYTAIFRVRDDVLTICGAPSGQPLPKEFASPVGSRLMLNSYRRAK